MEHPESISRDADEPLHGQVRRRIYDEIVGGVYAPGDRLPTEKEIAEKFGVSLAPVRAALGQLAQSGLIERTQGRGTFVLEPKVQYSLRLLSSCTQSLRLAHVEFEARVVDFAQQSAPVEVARQLKLHRGAKAFHLRRVMIVRGRPSILIESWLAPRIVELLPDRGFFEAGGSLYARLREQKVRLTRSTGHLEVSFCGEDEASLLGMGFGAPMLGLTSMSFDDKGGAVEWSRGLYDSSRFSLTLDRSLEGTIQ